jgi:YD repeat-containing protein
LLRPVLTLQDKFNNAIIEVSSYKNLNLIHATYTKYDSSLTPAGAIYPGRSKIINLQTPSSSFTNAAVSGNTITRDSRYLDESIYSFAFGNPVQITAHDGVSSSYIWDYLNTQPIAKVSNAAVDQVAFTSFEADGKGGWTFSGSPATDAAALTGTKDYTLNGSNNITKTGLSSAKSFVISYWSKTVSATVNGVSGTLLASANGWNYYEHKLAAGITSVTIGGSVKIDELRLYPSDAQMNSYTYSPLVGMTTSADANGRITFYQYDDLGRLITIKDQDGNIIKTVQYHYKGQVLP